MESNYNETGIVVGVDDNQDWGWDWEEVLMTKGSGDGEGDSVNHHQQQQQQHEHTHSNSNSILSNPNKSLEIDEDEGVVRGGDGDGLGVIHSDYFSLDLINSYHHGSIQHPEAEGDGVASEYGNGNGNGSWMDPEFPSCRGKRPTIRNSHHDDASDSLTDASSSSSCSSSTRNLLLILQPHSECTTTCHQFHHSQTQTLPLPQDESIAAMELETQSSLSHSPSAQLDDGVITLATTEEDQGQKPHQPPDEDIIKSCSNSHNDHTTAGRVAWWRLPLDLLKYCAFRVRPVWSLSMAAAAIMGFLLLRRTWLLIKINRKTRQGLRLNLIVDDKKVSQFMSRAARLSEAFSVVKRVPIVRPSLSAPGLAPWPIMSMR